ncbi:MAG: acetyl-CoA carboxylase biotin carboxyl carrier protein [Candidatus Limnocylindria bacterium]
MTDDDSVQAIARAAAELVPPLTERLTRLGLGEIEVRHGDLRVRVAAGEPPAAGAVPDVSGTRPVVAVTSAPVASTDRRLEPVTSPAVGHFVYADGLGPGLAVSAGAEIGFVEMLGVRHEVRASGDGVVRHLVAESGEPVEYGQLLVEVDRAGSG